MRQALTHLAQLPGLRIIPKPGNILINLLATAVDKTLASVLGYVTSFFS